MAATKKQILIVEDHPLNLKLFRDILRAKGFETIEDRVGKSCLEYARIHQPSLIILDVLLPYMSGIELARELKSNPITQNIPLLGVTALAITDTHDKMIEAGCVDCLTKPFTLDQFLKAIDHALEIAESDTVSTGYKKSAQSLNAYSNLTSSPQEPLRVGGNAI